MADTPPNQNHASPVEEAADDDMDAVAEGQLATADDAQTNGPNLDGSGDHPDHPNQADHSIAGMNPLDTRIPAKKDATLREFLGKMDDYAPIIPDAVTNYYLTLAGLPPPPQTHPHLARLLALTLQKFLADVAGDAYQYARIRSSNTSSNPMGGLGAAAGMGAAAGPQAGAAAAGAQGGKEGKGTNLGVQRPGFGGGGQGGGQGRTVLTMEDLGMALSEYGVNLRRGDFYR